MTHTPRTLIRTTHTPYTHTTHTPQTRHIHTHHTFTQITHIPQHMKNTTHTTHSCTLPHTRHIHHIHTYHTHANNTQTHNIHMHTNHTHTHTPKLTQQVGNTPRPGAMCSHLQASAPALSPHSRGWNKGEAEGGRGWGPPNHCGNLASRPTEPPCQHLGPCRTPRGDRLGS